MSKVGRTWALAVLLLSAVPLLAMDCSNHEVRQTNNCPGGPGGTSGPAAPGGTGGTSTGGSPDGSNTSGGPGAPSGSAAGGAPTCTNTGTNQGLSTRALGVVGSSD